MNFQPFLGNRKSQDNFSVYFIKKWLCSILSRQPKLTESISEKKTKNHNKILIHLTLSKTSSKYYNEQNKINTIDYSELITTKQRNVRSIFFSFNRSSDTSE